MSEGDLDPRCPHCAGPRSIGTLADWEDFLMEEGPASAFAGALRPMRAYLAQSDLIGWCPPCGCFAAVDGPHDDHGPTAG